MAAPTGSISSITTTCMVHSLLASLHIVTLIEHIRHGHCNRNANVMICMDGNLQSALHSVLDLVKSIRKLFICIPTLVKVAQ